MGFRSEEEALRAKTRALEEALTEARQALDASRPRLEQVDELERQLAETQAELEKLRGPARPRSSARVALSAGVGFTALLMLLGAVVAVRQAQVAEQTAVAAAMDRAMEDEELARAAERVAAEAQAAAAEAQAAAAEAQAAAAEAAAAEAEARANPPEPYAVRAGRVVSVSGPAPATEGAECTLTLERAPETVDGTRLEVVCAGRTVYGAPTFGYLPCSFEQDQPIRCEDRRGSHPNGDPMIVFDLGTDTAVIEDGPELAWSLRIALTPE